jgi:hypothetical protein
LRRAFRVLAPLRTGPLGPDALRASRPAVTDA